MELEQNWNGTWELGQWREIIKINFMKNDLYTISFENINVRVKYQSQ